MKILESLWILWEKRSYFLFKNGWPENSWLSNQNLAQKVDNMPPQFLATLVPWLTLVNPLLFPLAPVPVQLNSCLNPHNPVELASFAQMSLPVLPFGQNHSLLAFSLANLLLAGYVCLNSCFRFNGWKIQLHLLLLSTNTDTKVASFHHVVPSLFSSYACPCFTS